MIAIRVLTIDSNGMEKWLTTSQKDIPYLNIVRILSIRELFQRSMGLNTKLRILRIGSVKV